MDPDTRVVPRFVWIHTTVHICIGRNGDDDMGICICMVECSDSFPATMLCPISAITVKARSGRYVDRLMWIGLLVMVDRYRGVRAARAPAGEAERGLRNIAIGSPEDHLTSERPEEQAALWGQVRATASQRLAFKRN